MARQSDARKIPEGDIELNEADLALSAADHVRNHEYCVDGSESHLLGKGLLMTV